jgi:ABC-type branched-subunit amino acid transport system substrate-binding protein
MFSGLARRHKTDDGAAAVQSRVRNALLAAALCLVPMVMAGCQGVGTEALEIEPAAAAVSEETLGQGPVAVTLIASGEASARQRDIVDGARLAMDDLDGKYLTLSIRSVPANAVAAAAERAVASGAKAILGPMDRKGALDLATSGDGSHPPVLAFTDGAFPAHSKLWPLYGDEVDSAAEGARMVVGAGQTELAILYPAGFDSADIARLEERIDNWDGKVVTKIAYPDTEAGIASILANNRKQIDRAQSAVVLGGGYGLVRVLAELTNGKLGQGLRSVIVTSAMPKKSYGLPSAQGLIVALPASGGEKRIAKRFSDRYGRAPSYDAAIGYDAVAIVAGLAAGSNAKSLEMESITRPTGFRGASGLFRFGQGVIERRYEVFRIEDGSPKLIQVEGEGF